MTHEIGIMSSKLDQFLKEYEVATNTHDFDKVAPLLDKDAVYWFSDGSYIGVNTIRQAFVDTWNKIQNEKYQIRNTQWISVDKKLAVCVYDFYWEGEVDGEKLSGTGRGTNVIGKVGDRWKMLHEHLSKST
ncbi:MAG: DUF4440 domain-containing protein [Candidatus Moranbacteria bacterium]|nr:DUF4440 domain-containing protein [Candidatus Moranbacteria bacterium]